MSLIVPIFRDSGFDAEATGALGKAYDIASRALHPKVSRRSYKKSWPRRLSRSRSAVSAILTGWRRSLWPTWARFTAK